MNKIFKTIGTSTVITALISVTVPTVTAAATISSVDFINDDPVRENTSLNLELADIWEIDRGNDLNIPLVADVVSEFAVLDSENSLNVSDVISSPNEFRDIIIIDCYITPSEIHCLIIIIFDDHLLAFEHASFRDSLAFEDASFRDSLAFEDASFRDSFLAFEDASLAFGDSPLAFKLPQEKNSGDRTTIPEPSGVLALGVLGLGAVASRLLRRRS